MDDIEMKPALLFLVHRIPFPPNKGDKIRSYNMMKELSKDFDIHLGCFIDDHEDIGFEPELLQFCKSVKCIQQNKLLCKVKGLQGFLSNKAITLPYYSSAEMQKWTNETISQNQIQRVLVFSAAMAQFVEQHLSQLRHTVLDFVDVDSDKWRQYASEKSGIKAWFYNREARLLQDYEVQMTETFDASTFVSDDEAGMFKTMLADNLKDKVSGVRNGVDTSYFDPKSDFKKVESISENSIVFTGAMDYWANVNAVIWFTDNVWPLVLAAKPDAHFYIVGSNPTSKVQALNGKQNITVTGRVEDVRPYIEQTKLSIAPLQIARGTQNKVLEALSMAKPIVLSSMAAEGINKPSTADYQVQDDASAMAKLITDLLEQGIVVSQQNRAFVIEHFSWESEMHKFTDLLNGVTG
ncbi:TIGR03087 family PEP-CTERM/XrtA system glycosyltransferase [Glaciecola sp. MF2-115]|uniref:TIGR03087 family PEP-CTERM/XrtA system glycosyltransferase n=1 Tax=Glaciecola sp. MF2-115 TaxID=3384827 RepID=UPI0039A02B80